MKEFSEKLRWAILGACVIVGAAIMASLDGAREAKRIAREKGRTDTQVEAIIGIPAENKLGGIKFTVTDGRYKGDYSKVTFFVHGFNAGLTLDRVVCFRVGKEYSFNWQSYEWKNWLKEFQKVLAEATIGEKDTDLLDPNLIPVSDWLPVK